MEAEEAWAREDIKELIATARADAQRVSSVRDISELAPLMINAEEYDALALNFETLETMILTLDASQLLDHMDDHKSILLGSGMFGIIVDQLNAMRLRPTTERVSPKFQRAFDHWKEVEDICRSGDPEGERLDESKVLYEALMGIPAAHASEVAMKLQAMRIYYEGCDFSEGALNMVEAELREIDRAAARRHLAFSARPRCDDTYSSPADDARFGAEPDRLSPAMIDAISKWKVAAKAYGTACSDEKPEEELNRLSIATHDASRAIAAFPARTMEDFAVKVYLLALVECGQVGPGGVGS